jgi:outer membrane protein assembly factor BamA
VLSATLHAQTYNPKEIRFDGAKAYSNADLLAISGLKPGRAVSVEDIRAALQHLADTGLFADTRYAVNSQALTLTLTPIDARKTLPLHYSNFVWWTPDQLTAMLHERVPLFLGTVPLDGNLIDSVKHALIAILAEKGITASVDSMSSSVGGAAIAVTITSPEIKVGDIRFDGAAPAGAEEMTKVRAKVSGEDFDEIASPKALVNETEQIYRDDGYLDVVATSSAHAAPRAEGSRFLIDLVETVHGDELYRVSSAEVRAAAPVSAGDLQKLVQIKTGAAAAAYDLRTAESRLASPYRRLGYLDAEARVDAAKDPAAHRIGYTFILVPGEQYHVASVQTSGFTPEQQAEFEKSFHVAPNATLGEEFSMQIGMLNQRRAFNGLRLQPRMDVDRKQHTVAITLSTARAPVH